MGGDFNCPLNHLVDKRGGILNQRKSATACIDCLQTELDGVKNPLEYFAVWITG